MRSTCFRPLAFAASLALTPLALACSDGSGEPSDGAVDGPGEGGAEAGRDASAADAGPSCPEPCGSNEQCCRVDGGAAACVDVVRNDRHCGGCGIECTGVRGTACVDRQCVCGSSVVACSGSIASACCPPRTDGGTHYCADLESDGDDCGECGVQCEPAVGDRCAGGRCVCGEDDRTGCEGTMTDHCCPDGPEQWACADLTTDGRNCGACGNTCDPSDRCCGGVCCDFASCDDGVCTDAADGGVPDAAADAGAPDATAGDGGG